MKKVIVFSAAFLALFGCTKVESFMSKENSNKEIGFSTYTGRAVTKSGTTLNQSFSVESFLSAIPAGASTRTLFFPSTKYTYANNHYTGEITRVWPQTGNLDFYAVSPLQYKNTSAANVDLAPASDSTFTVTGTDGTTDIVAARLVDVLNGTDPVELVFGHKMTKVAFKAIGADQAKKYVIKDIILTANSSASYQFGETESWGAAADAYGYDYVSSDVVIAANTSTAQPVGTAKYLIPAQGTSVTALVKYQIYEADVLVDDCSAGVSVNLPATAWGINKSVVYTLTLNYSSATKIINFHATVEDWDADTEVNVNVPLCYIENGINFGAGTKIGDVVWAPVNCGTDTSSTSNYLYGKLYQWGRKYPCEYNATWTDGNGTHSAENVLQTNTNISAPITADMEEASKFYVVTGDPDVYYFMWLNPVDTTRWNSAPYPNSAGQFGNISPSKTVHDPCPDGWRVPTYAEFEALIGGDTIDVLQDGTGLYSGMKGRYFNGTPTADSGVFLPAAGCRDFYGVGGGSGPGLPVARNTDVCYWTSTAEEEYGEPFSLWFYEGEEAGLTDSYTSYGFSVRCVAE